MSAHFLRALRTLFSLACCSDIQEKNFVLPLQSWKPLEALPISAKLKQQTWNVEHQVGWAVSKTCGKIHLYGFEGFIN